MAKNNTATEFGDIYGPSIINNSKVDNGIICDSRGTGGNFKGGTSAYLIPYSAEEQS